MLSAGAARPRARGRTPMLQVLEQWTRMRPPVSQGTGAADAALQDGSHGEHVLPRPCPDPQPRPGLHAARDWGTVAPTARHGLDRARCDALSDQSAGTAATVARDSDIGPAQHNP